MGLITHPHTQSNWGITIRFLNMSSFIFPIITSGGWFNLILEEGPFFSWESKFGELGISAESSTTLKVSGVLGDAGSCSTISWTSFGLGGRISLGNSSLTFSDYMCRRSW